MDQALGAPLSDIPEEAQGKHKILAKTSVNSVVQLGFQMNNGNKGDNQNGEVIENDCEPEHAHENDKEKQKRPRVALSTQNESGFPILSSSSSSDIHIVTNTGLSNCVSDNTFGCYRHQQEFEKKIEQEQKQSLFGSNLMASSYESDYGSMDNLEYNSSVSISLDQNSSFDTSLYNSDTMSIATVKIRNSNDSTCSFKHGDRKHKHKNSSKIGSHTNNANELTFLTAHDNNPHMMHDVKHHQKTMPLSPQRKPPVAQHQYKHGKQSSTSFDMSNKDEKSALSESVPILSTSHRHHHYHEKYYSNNPSKRIESLHRIHSRQRRVSHTIENLKGVEQSTSFRDVQFSLLFFVQLSTMIFLTLKYGPQAIQESPDVIAPADITTTAHASVKQKDLLFTCEHAITLATCSGLISIVISNLALIFMTLIAEKLVQIALYLAMTLAFAWGTIGAIVLSENSHYVPIAGLALLGLITAYTIIAWERIPFASANLKTALTAIRSQPAVVAVAFALQMLMLVWAMLSMFMVVGIYNAFHQVTVNTRWKVVCYIWLGVSCYWNVQLLLCMVHVTVAGVVKNWWFHEKSIEHHSLSISSSSPPSSPSSSSEQPPNHDQNKCEAVVMKSFHRAAFHSFGSVCFGSLLVTFVRILRRIPKYTNPCGSTRDISLQDRSTSGMDLLGLKFNRFAFIYVGMYGYSFIEAGERASALLKKRGWKKIVTDNLVSDVLLLVSLVIGGVSGCLTVWIESVGFSVISSRNPTGTSFLIGFTIGLVLSSILFGIISSSVNAVIILFAGNPVEFEENHPTLSHEMRAAWKEVFPGKVDFVETTNHSCLI